MSTVASEIEVCNLALDLIKEAPISAFEDNRSVARWMGRNYGTTRDFVLSVFPWKFAMARTKLTPDATAPEFEWNKRYRKPFDAIRVLPLRVNGHMDGRLINHEVEGDYILCDETKQIYVKYIKRVETVGSFSPLFVDALSNKLAARVSHWLSHKASMVELSEARFKEALEMAISIDSAEGSHPAQVAYYYDQPRDYHYTTDQGDVYR